jgi:hypothetical protein
MAEEKKWMSFDNMAELEEPYSKVINLRNLQFYATVVNGLVKTAEASVMKMHDDKYRWHLRVNSMVGFEETEELAKAKVIEELNKLKKEIEK